MDDIKEAARLLAACDCEDPECEKRALAKRLEASRAIPQTLDGATVEACARVAEDVVCNGACQHVTCAALRAAAADIRALSPRTDGPPAAPDWQCNGEDPDKCGCNGRGKCACPCHVPVEPAPSATQGVSARPAREGRLVDNEALVDRLCASGLHPDDVIRTSSVLMRGRRQGVLAMLRLVDEHLATRTTKETP